MEEVAQVLQSNEDSIAETELEFVVTVAQSRRGGAHLKLDTVPHDEILANKGQFLYNANRSVENNNLCFYLCLAHYANTAMSDHEKLVYAKQLHSVHIGRDHMVNRYRSLMLPNLKNTLMSK